MIGRLIERIIGPVSDLLSEVIEDPDERARIEAELRMRLLSHEAGLVEASRDVVVAEAQGESYLQRNWRPIMMLTFVAIIANNFILAPYIGALGGAEVYLDLPERIWDLLTLGVTGYVVGRSAEKISRDLGDARVRQAEASGKSS